MSAKRNRNPKATRGSEPRFSAALTQAQMEEIEEAAQRGVPGRRLALAFLTKGSADLLESAKEEETAAAFMSAAESIGSYLRWRAEETKMLKTAEARVLSVLAYEYGVNLPAGSAK